MWVRKYDREKWIAKCDRDYKRIASDMVEICSHIVQLRVPSCIHIVAGKCEHLCIQ